MKRVENCTTCDTYIGDERYDSLAKCKPCGASYKTEAWRRQKDGFARWRSCSLRCLECQEIRTSENTYHKAGTRCKTCSKRNSRRWVEDNIGRRRAYTLSYKNRIKTEVIASYGGKCECCDEAHPAFLTIHHKLNDGGEERRRLKKLGAAFYVWLRDQGFPRDRYGLLCANCNSAEQWYGICPHRHEREERDEEEATWSKSL